MVSISQVKEKWQETIDRFRMRLALDLGSKRSLIYLAERGIVVEEASALARIKKKRWQKKTVVVAYGDRAAIMQEKEPRKVEVVWPMMGGEIQDLSGLTMLVSWFFKKLGSVPTRYPAILKTRGVVGVSYEMSNVQRRAIRGVFEASGGGKLTFINQAAAALLGVSSVKNNIEGLVVDVGAGKTEMSLVSGGGIVLSKKLNVGGDSMDLAIINFIKIKYGILIGLVTARRAREELGKIEVGEKTVVRGRSLESGLPVSIRVDQGEIGEALALELTKIVKNIKTLSDQAPPEIMAQVTRRGIVLVGGASLQYGLREQIESELKISCLKVAEPDRAVIRGLSKLLDDQELARQLEVMGQ
jgi:rod shape-determining protein MreB